MDLLPALVVGIVVIAISTVLARRLGVAGPLILVAVGLIASLFLPPFAVDPELILVGILPPLLYAAAVRMPAIEFRRDALPITGLAVILVVVSALLLGTLFFFTLPELGFPLAVALGAILSPTDAVATSIVKKLGISPRVVTMLEGESLLNDATALVLLRSAVAAVAAGFSFWGTVGSFAWGVAVAVVIGVVMGMLNLRVRRSIPSVAANTALGFVVPFLAFLPTEHLGGSGLVAAVAAGITTGQGTTRFSTPEQRVSDGINWRTVELLLEGAVFLIMGLELRDIVTATVQKHDGPWIAVGLALAALGIVLVVRTGYVTLIVALQGHRARQRQRERLLDLDERLEAFDADRPAPSGSGRHPLLRRRLQRESPEARRRRVGEVRARITRGLNDLDYYQASPLGWKHGTIIVWAGMRGVVTLAAAQTLPTETPARELLILIAFLVALVSLLLQGLSLPFVIRLLRIPAAGDETLSVEEQEELDRELRAAALERLDRPGLLDAQGAPVPAALVAAARERLAGQPRDDLPGPEGLLELRVLLIEAMRERLITLSHEGAFSSAALRHELAVLDADQLSIELRRGPESE